MLRQTMFFSLTLVSYVSYCFADAMSDSYPPLYLSFTSVNTNGDLCKEREKVATIYRNPTSSNSNFYIAQLEEEKNATIWAAPLWETSEIPVSTMWSDFTTDYSNLTFYGGWGWDSPSIALPHIDYHKVRAFTELSTFTYNFCGNIYLIESDCAPYSLVPLQMWLNATYNSYFFLTVDPNVKPCK